MNTFITSQFSYCPLLCIIHSQTLNNQINKIYEKALRLVYKNEKFLFLRLAKKQQISPKNLQILATEI